MVQTENEGDISAVDGLTPERPWGCVHGSSLSGARRCPGCGRTKNEIELDGE